MKIEKIELIEVTLTEDEFYLIENALGACSGNGSELTPGDYDKASDLYMSWNIPE